MQTNHLFGNNDLLNPNQFDFRKNSNTGKALVKVSEGILKKLYRGKK